MPRWLRTIQKDFPVAYEQLYTIPNDARLCEFCNTAEPSDDASLYHIAQSDPFTVNLLAPEPSDDASLHHVAQSDPFTVNLLAPELFFF